MSLAAFSSALLCGAVFASHERRASGSIGGCRAWLLAALLAGLLLWGMPKARPEKFLALNEADHSPQAIAARGIA